MCFVKYRQIYFVVLLIIMFFSQFTIDQYIKKVTECLKKLLQIEFDSDEEEEEQDDEFEGFRTQREVFLRSVDLDEEGWKVPEVELPPALFPREKLARGLIKLREVLRDIKRKQVDRRDLTQLPLFSAKTRSDRSIRLMSDTKPAEYTHPKKAPRFESISEDDLPVSRHNQGVFSGNLLSLDTFGMANRALTIFEQDRIESFDVVCVPISEYNPLLWPAAWWDRLLYLVLLPPNLVFFFLFPNLLDPASKRKTKTMFVMCIGSTMTLVFLLVLLEYSLLFEFRLKPHILSLFNSLVFVFK